VQFDGISLPIAAGLLIMMHRVLAKVRCGRLDSVTGDRKLMLSSLLLNCVVGWALMFALLWLLPPDLPEYQTGLIVCTKNLAPTDRDPASSRLCVQFGAKHSEIKSLRAGRLHVLFDAASTDESMIHLLHHQVKNPGQRVTAIAADVAVAAGGASLHRRDGGRKVLHRKRRRWEERWLAGRRVMIHLIQYVVA
jgi:hypothetical protein